MLGSREPVRQPRVPAQLIQIYVSLDDRWDDGIVVATISTLSRTKQSTHPIPI